MVPAMRTAGIIVAAALSLAALHGHARGDASRAWAAAKAGLPADTKFVFGVDVAAIQKTQLFATYYPKLRDKPEAAEIFDAVRETCKLDPVEIVRGVVVGMSSDHEDGAAYVALAGVDRAKLSSCLQLVTQARTKDAKVSLKQAGNITEISQGTGTAFVGWVGKDVIVIALHAQDRPALVKWMGGRGALARSALGKSLAKVNTSAAMWGAGEGDKDLEPGITLKGGYGTVTYAKGNVSADVHTTMGSAAEANKMASSANKQIDEAKQSGVVPPEIAAVLNAVTISVDKDQVRVMGSMVEKDLLGALALALGGL